MFISCGSVESSGAASLKLANNRGLLSLFVLCNSGPLQAGPVPFAREFHLPPTLVSPLLFFFFLFPFPSPPLSPPFVSVFRRSQYSVQPKTDVVPRGPEGNTSDLGSPVTASVSPADGASPPANLSPPRDVGRHGARAPRGSSEGRPMPVPITGCTAKYPVVSYGRRLRSPSGPSMRASRRLSVMCGSLFLFLLLSFSLSLFLALSLSLALPVYLLRSFPFLCLSFRSSFFCRADDGAQSCRSLREEGGRGKEGFFVSGATDGVGENCLKLTSGPSWTWDFSLPPPSHPPARARPSGQFHNKKGDWSNK